MYIRSVHIENIRSIESFDMAFVEGHEAGWHVLIGENGSGKTTIARALAVSLFGPEDSQVVNGTFSDWIRYGAEDSTAILTVRIDPELDIVPIFPSKDVERGQIKDGQSIHFNEDLEDIELPDKSYRLNFIDFPQYEGIEFGPAQFVSFRKWIRPEKNLTLLRYIPFFVPIAAKKEKFVSFTTLIGQVPVFNRGWFASGFGPFRRFDGGVENPSKIFENSPRVEAFATLFEPNFTLSSIRSWLRQLFFEEHEKKNNVLRQIGNFLNDGELLPRKLKLNGLTSEGVFFEDIHGKLIELSFLSDGHRSVLSLTFELIRQLIRTYGEEKVFANIQKGEMNIPLPGVVIIDEVDAHLHPTWQTKIGQWFTKYFPQLQFIVTTHSPLICRACGEHGKIFKLAAPGSEKPSGEITGLNRDRLVYGDILEAYETDEFGDGVEWSDEGRKLQKEYRELVYRKRYGEPMDESESERLNHLKSIFNFRVEAE